MGSGFGAPLYVHGHLFSLQCFNPAVEPTKYETICAAIPPDTGPPYPLRGE